MNIFDLFSNERVKRYLELRAKPCCSDANLHHYTVRKPSPKVHPNPKLSL